MFAKNSTVVELLLVGVVIYQERFEVVTQIYPTGQFRIRSRV
jgi:hypothetical protein